MSIESEVRSENKSASRNDRSTGTTEAGYAFIDAHCFTNKLNRPYVLPNDLTEIVRRVQRVLCH
jgi:hypothetical protein